MATLLALSYFENALLLYLMLFSTMAGTLYHITIVPRPLRKLLRYSTLKDIPTSRDIFVALAWGVTLTFVPHATMGYIVWGWPTAICFLEILVLGFLRSLIFDLKDIEGDRIMGRETLITIIGEKNVRKGIKIILGLALTGLAVSPLVLALGSGDSFSRENMMFLPQIPVFLYIAAFLRWKHRIRREQSALFGGFADAQFYISALCSWIALQLL
jgi:4-hydroxybenzoate polyprenyltransferase